jgi:hypothetical protein
MEALQALELNKQKWNGASSVPAKYHRRERKEALQLGMVWSNDNGKWNCFAIGRCGDLKQRRRWQRRRWQPLESRCVPAARHARPCGTCT